MAEDDMGDKTEAPTARRRQEAREQGNIARSSDLSAAALLVSGLLLVKSFGPKLVIALKALVTQMLSLTSHSEIDIRQLGPLLMHAIGVIAVAVAPLMVGIVLIAILSNVAQTGLVFSTTKLTPNFAALNPTRGFSKLFSKGQGTVRFVMSVLKLFLVGLTAYSAVHGRLLSIVLSSQLPFSEVFALASTVVYAIALRVGLLLLVLAILDYAYQRYHMEQELKMSKQAIKEEMKRMDGDPRIKARRRQIAMQQLRERLKNDVPKADVIVTNPTEFAVALKYDADSMNAPRVVAKGQGFIAARIRELAIANGIPILERKPLARALYKICKGGPGSAGRVLLGHRGDFGVRVRVEWEDQTEKGGVTSLVPSTGTPGEG